jgi:putative flippase GtrA
VRRSGRLVGSTLSITITERKHGGSVRKAPVASTIARVYSWAERLLPRYALAFGIVGLVSYFVDLGIFNGLRLGVFGTTFFVHQPLAAKVISVTISTLASWFGNRYFAFRDRRRSNFLLELVEFACIAVVGLGIGLGCLYVSHYVLGFTGLLADNISANVIGLILGTIFRFLMYRFWVYGANRAGGANQRATTAQAGVDATGPVGDVDKSIIG